jgi:hypothetical protein
MADYIITLTDNEDGSLNIETDGTEDAPEGSAAHYVFKELIEHLRALMVVNAVNRLKKQAEAVQDRCKKATPAAEGVE